MTDITEVPADELGAFLAFLNQAERAGINEDIDALMQDMVSALGIDLAWPHRAAKALGLTDLGDRTVAHHYIQFMHHQLNSLADA